MAEELAAELAASEDGAKVSVEVDGRVLQLSNLDKVLYPETGFTKADVVRYYVDVAPHLLPHLADRPLTLRRFPDGVSGQTFYQKHRPKGTPSWVKSVTLPSSPRGRELIDFLFLDSLPSLVWAANLAALELHAPMWKVGGKGEPVPPDLMVFDLDPGAPATLVECCAVAQLLAGLLEEEHGWTAYPKTSGSKGLQLYVALPAEARQRDWADGATREEAHRLAELAVQARPELVVANMRKDLRRGRVLIDWSQNNVAKTTVAVYSLRARPEPTVSMPVTWDEVAETAAGDDPTALAFEAPAVPARLAEMGDLFAPLLSPGRAGRSGSPGRRPGRGGRGPSS